MDINLNFSDSLSNITGPIVDLSISGGDLTHDDGLKTAVILSLFTDRLAAADDVIPDGSADRRGFWGDLPIDNANTGASKDYIGSKLWLLNRAKQTDNTLALIKSYATEALQWLIDDGVAQTFTVAAAYAGIGVVKINIVIFQQSPTGQVVNTNFNLLWNQTLVG